jgi:hypothetical protein
LSENEHFRRDIRLDKMAGFFKKGKTGISGERKQKKASQLRL